MSCIKYWVWMANIPGVGPKKGMELLEHFGDPENLWNASGNELIAFQKLKPIQVKQILSSANRENAVKYIEDMDKHGIYALTYRDAQYPQMLKNIYDPPLVLYIKGKISNKKRMISVVGSRKATQYGRETAEQISYKLAQHDIGIVSGMARGIDTCAHIGALKAGGYTIAVLGCGLDMAYPEENELLMEQITGNGAVISEYVPGIKPRQNNFPARNRIISGISNSVVIVEAGERSGSLITASMAAEQGREVFAVPGNISNEMSKGTNQLIRDGARIVTDLSDIIEELNYTETISNKNYNFIFESLLSRLEGDEKKIGECLNNEIVHIDTIVSRTGLGVQKVNSLLIIMEMKGIIEQMPGKMFKIKYI